MRAQQERLLCHSTRCASSGDSCIGGPRLRRASSVSFIDVGWLRELVVVILCCGPAGIYDIGYSVCIQQWVQLLVASIYKGGRVRRQSRGTMPRDIWAHDLRAHGFCDGNSFQHFLDFVEYNVTLRDQPVRFAFCFVEPLYIFDYIYAIFLNLPLKDITFLF